MRAPVRQLLFPLSLIVFGLGLGCGAGVIGAAGSAGQSLAGAESIRGIGGLCLDAKGRGTGPGTVVQLWQCSGGANQLWSGPASGMSGVVKISTGACLVPSGGASTDGTPLVLGGCDGAMPWEHGADGTLRGPGGKCLDIRGSGSGAPSQLWHCWGGANQKFDFQGTSAASSPVTVLAATPATVTTAPGAPATLSLHFRGGPTPSAETLFVHVRDPAGNIVFQDDHLPSPATTRWTESEFAETRTLQVPSSLAAGSYEVVVGLYSASTGVRLALAPGADVIDRGESAYRVATLVVGGSGGGGSGAGYEIPEPTCTRTYAVPGLSATGDNTAALNSAFAAALPGDCLVLPAGTFRHSGNLDVKRPGFMLAGAGVEKTVLLGTTPATAGYRVLAGGDEHQLRRLTHRVLGAASRGDQNEQGMSTLLLETGVRGFRGEDLLLEGAQAAGFFSYGAQDYILNRVEVRGSHADGFHNTRGSANGQFFDCVARGVGDDMFAVIHYEQDPLEQQSHDISFTRPRGYGNTWGRGFGIVCVKNITVTDAEVNDTSAAGIYIGRETGAHPADVRNIRFLGHNSVNRANFGTPDHGAVFLLNGNGDAKVEDVLLENVRITDTNAQRASFAGQTVRAVVYGGGTIDATLSSFTFAGTNPPSPFGGNTDAGSHLVRIGW